MLRLPKPNCSAIFLLITVCHYEKVPPFSSVCLSTRKSDFSPNLLRTFSEPSPSFFSVIAIELFLNNSTRNILSNSRNLGFGRPYSSAALLQHQNVRIHNSPHTICCRVRNTGCTGRNKNLLLGTFSCIGSRETSKSCFPCFHKLCCLFVIRKFNTLVSTSCSRYGSIYLHGYTIVCNPCRQWILQIFTLFESPQEVVHSGFTETCLTGNFAT